MGIPLVSLRLGKTDEVLKVLSNVARRQIEIEHQQQQREQQREEQEEQECDEEDVVHEEGEMPMIPSSPDGHTLDMSANNGDLGCGSGGDGDGVTLGGDCESGEGKERDKEAEGYEGWGETGKEAVKEGKESAGGMAVDGQAQHQVIIIQSKIFIIHSLFSFARLIVGFFVSFCWERRSVGLMHEGNC